MKYFFDVIQVYLEGCWSKIHYIMGNIFKIAVSMTGIMQLSQMTYLKVVLMMNTFSSQIVFLVDEILQIPLQKGCFIFNNAVLNQTNFIIIIHSPMPHMRMAPVLTPQM